MRSRAPSESSLQKALQRLRRASPVDPRAVLLVDMEKRRCPWRNGRCAARFRRPKSVLYRLRLEIDHGLPGLRQERIDQHDGRYGPFHLLRDTGNDHAPVRVADQNNVAQLLPFHLVDNVENVRVEIDGGRQQM